MTSIQVVEQQVVKFAGTDLLGAKTADGKIYAAVKWVSEGIGLSEGQLKSERKKVQEDLVLSKGGRNLVLPTNGGIQDVLCIEIDFLPLWLAKISITPKMQIETPWVANRLIEFQLKAKDVLAEAFLPKKRPLTQAEMFLQSAQQLVMIEREMDTIKERTNVLEQNQQNISEIITLSNDEAWRKNTTQLLNRIAVVKGGPDCYRVVRNKTYVLLEQRAKCNLKRRLENCQKRLELEGYGKTAANNITRLDIIASDVKLKEIYIAIIKEMAIKYSVSFGEVEA